MKVFPAEVCILPKRFCIAVLLLLSLALMVPAQSGGPAWSERQPGLTPMELLPGYDLAVPDVNLLLEEDAERGRNRTPWRVAKILPLNLNVTEEANWETLQDGSLVGRLRLEAPGALFLSAKFSAFQLPGGGELRLRPDYPLDTEMLSETVGAAWRADEILFRNETDGVSGAELAPD